MPHATQMSAADTGLLVIDVQEKLVPRIIDADRLVANIAFLIDAARLLNLPVQCTEQYPRGLGATVPELAAKLPQRPDKVAFSSLRRAGRRTDVSSGSRPKWCCAASKRMCASCTRLSICSPWIFAFTSSSMPSGRATESITMSLCAAWSEPGRF